MEPSTDLLSIAVAVGAALGAGLAGAKGAAAAVKRAVGEPAKTPAEFNEAARGSFGSGEPTVMSRLEGILAAANEVRGSVESLTERFDREVKEQAEQRGGMKADIQALRVSVGEVGVRVGALERTTQNLQKLNGCKPRASDTPTPAETHAPRTPGKS